MLVVWLIRICGGPLCSAGHLCSAGRLQQELRYGRWQENFSPSPRPRSCSIFSLCPCCCSRSLLPLLLPPFLLLLLLPWLSPLQVLVIPYAPAPFLRFKPGFCSPPPLLACVVVVAILFARRPRPPGTSWYPTPGRRTVTHPLCPPGPLGDEPYSQSLGRDESPRGSWIYRCSFGVSGLLALGVPPRRRGWTRLDRADGSSEPHAMEFGAGSALGRPASRRGGFGQGISSGTGIPASRRGGFGPAVRRPAPGVRGKRGLKPPRRRGWTRLDRGPTLESLS